MNATDTETEVVLTDYESAIPLLEANIDANRNIVKQKVKIKAEPLEWGLLKVGMGKFDIICGSDLLYGAEASYQPLVDTISALLSKKSSVSAKGSIILLGVRWRKPDKERRFFELAECSDIEFILLGNWVGNLLTDVSTKVLSDMPTLGWRQYGDVDNEPFLQHCSNTRVSTGGGKRTVSLIDLSATDIEDMNDAEHLSFERTQMQFYVGKWKEAESKRATCIEESEADLDIGISKRTKI